MRPLKGIRECVERTQDYFNLLEALKVNETDPEKLMIYKFIYYQAEYESLLKDFNKIIDGLDSKDHKAAGLAYSKLLKNMVSVVKKDGLVYLANEGMMNGFAVNLDLNNPSDSLACWDNKTSSDYLNFVYAWAKAITDGSWNESPVNTQFFWRDIGKELFEKIPDSVWKCLSKSNDNQQFISKIGLDFYDDSFDDLFMRFINNHRLNYYLTMKGIQHSFDRYNFGHAGYVYGHFINQLAKSNSTDDGTMETLKSVSF